MSLVMAIAGTNGRLRSMSRRSSIPRSRSDQLMRIGVVLVLMLVLAPLLLVGVGAPPAGAAENASRTKAVATSFNLQNTRTVAATARTAPKTYRINTNSVRQRVGPGTQHAAFKARLNKSSRVRIYCTVRNAKGQLWDKISRRNVYVLDKFVSTGTNKPVKGACGKPKRKLPPRPVVPPPMTIPPNSYRHVNHWWYSELLFNKPATAQAARDTENFCDDLADIPLIGVGEKYFCRTYYLEFRRAAQQAVAQNRCVRWVFGLQFIPKPDTYAGDFCR